MQSQRLEVVVSCEGVELARQAVASGSYTFGSSPVCEFYVDAPRVSPRHFQVTIASNGAMLLKNLPTPAGTFLDGKPITVPTPFHSGQKIAIGDVRIEFHESNSTVDAPAELSLAEPTPPLPNSASQPGVNAEVASDPAGPAASPNDSVTPAENARVREPLPIRYKTLAILVSLLVVAGVSAFLVKKVIDERDRALLERDRAEAARRSAEAARQTAETARQAAETARQTAETAQQKAEAARKEADALIGSMQSDLLATYTVLGRTMLSLDDTEGQVAALTKAVEVGRAIVKSNPKDDEATRLTGEAYANIGATLFRQKNLKEARPMFERYLEVIDQLSKEKPDNYQYQVDAAEARIKVVSCGDLGSEKGIQDFIAATKEGVALLEKLQKNGGLQPAEEASLKMYRDALKEMGAN